MGLFLLGSLASIVIVALGAAFDILLAKRLEAIWGERALSITFLKPLRAGPIGFVSLLVGGYVFNDWIKYPSGVNILNIRH